MAVMSSSVLSRASLRIAWDLCCSRRSPWRCYTCGEEEGGPDHGAAGPAELAASANVEPAPEPAVLAGVGKAEGGKASRGKGRGRLFSGNLPGAPAADLTRAPPASIAAAPSVQSPNNSSSSSSYSSSSSCVGCLDGECHTHLLNVSCTNNILANSAHQSNWYEMS